MTAATNTPPNLTDEEVKQKIDHVTKCASILFMASVEMCKEDATILLSTIAAVLSRTIVEVITQGMSQENFDIFMDEFTGKIKENVGDAYKQVSAINAANAKNLESPSDTLVKG